MALTYAESAALMKDEPFIARVKVACLHYANYIFNEASSTPAHNTRIRWAQQATSNPDFAGQTTTPPVVMDNQVQQDGAAITDAALQTTVETVVNNLM